jgi:hypothetical protein
MMKTRTRSIALLLASGLIAYGGASVAQTAPSTGTPQPGTTPGATAPNPAAPSTGSTMTNNGPTAQQNPQGQAPMRTSPSTSQANQPMNDPQGQAPMRTSPSTSQANQPMNGKNSLPTRSDSAANAFRMLDPSNRGYITRADADRIPGFQGFDSADADRDGHLTPQEFANAWKSYSGK